MNREDAVKAGIEAVLKLPPAMRKFHDVVVIATVDAIMPDVDAAKAAWAADYAAQDERIGELQAEVERLRARWRNHSCAPRDVLDMD